MASLNDDKITFRHPHILAGKYPKNFCFGVGKFADLEQKQIKLDLERILEAKPLSPADAPKHEDGTPLHDRAVAAYFDPMAKAGVKGPKDRSSTFRNTYGPFYSNTKPSGAALRWRERAEKAEARILELEARVLELEAFIKSMQAVSGARAKAERETPLMECVAHFEKNFRVKGSQEQRDDIIRRVKVVADAIGMATKYAATTLHAIEDGITASKPVTEGETFKRKQAIKRFFRFLCLPTNEGGMGFGGNPAQNMYVGSVGAIQKRNVQRNGIELIDPAALLAIENLSPFHRAAFAVLGYSGLRLSEMAGLLWDDIDYENKVIRIKPNDVKTGMKTHNSNRLVKPFGNVWPILEAWRHQADGGRFVFPRPSNGNTWFTIYKGAPRCVALSHFMQDELKRKKFEPNDEVSRRLRRFWATKMAEMGYGEFESIMGGHSKATADAHYQERERLVMAAKIGSI